jgi:hypothetical protein
MDSHEACKSPLYVFATNDASDSLPIICPQPLLHSRTNAAEHRFGNNSQVYNPSVTAIRVLLVIDLLNQDTPPVTVKCFHSQVFPHDCNTSKKEVGASFGLTYGSVDMRHQCFPPSGDWTEKIVFC